MLDIFSTLANIIRPSKPRIPVALLITYDFEQFLDLQQYLNRPYVCGTDVRELNIKIYVDDRASIPCESFYTWEDFDLAISEINRNSKNYAE